MHSDLKMAGGIANLGFLLLMIVGIILMAEGSGLGIMEAVIAIMFVLAGTSASKAAGFTSDPPNLAKYTKRARNLAIATLVILVIYMMVFIYLVVEEFDGEGAWGLIIFIVLIVCLAYVLKKLGPTLRYIRSLPVQAPMPPVAPMAPVQPGFAQPPQPGMARYQQPQPFSPPPPDQAVAQGGGGGQDQHEQQ
jgi:hypothetical protein